MRSDAAALQYLLKEELGQADDSPIQLALAENLLHSLADLMGTYGEDISYLSFYTAEGVETFLSQYDHSLLEALKLFIRYSCTTGVINVFKLTVEDFDTYCDDFGIVIEKPVVTQEPTEEIFSLDDEPTEEIFSLDDEDIFKHLIDKVLVLDLDSCLRKAFEYEGINSFSDLMIMTEPVIKLRAYKDDSGKIVLLLGVSVVQSVY